MISAGVDSRAACAAFTCACRSVRAAPTHTRVRVKPAAALEMCEKYRRIDFFLGKFRIIIVDILNVKISYRIFTGAICIFVLRMV